jgi:LysR family hydrogen peroxide-inducible transcriptional activator
MTPKGHRLAAKEPLRPSDMKAAEMVLLEDGHCLRDETLDVCPVNRRGSIREFHATSLETLKHLVASGAGYTLMPLFAADEDSRMKGLLTYRKFEGKQVGRTIVLACRESFARKDEIRLLAEFIRRKTPKVSFHGVTASPYSESSSQRR